MPLREYIGKDARQGCPHCRAGYEVLEAMDAEAETKCPRCGAAVRRSISAPAVGSSQSGADARAKSAGFHKLKRIGKGEYEKEY